MHLTCHSEHSEEGTSLPSVVECLFQAGEKAREVRIWAGLAKSVKATPISRRYFASEVTGRAH